MRTLHQNAPGQPGVFLFQELFQGFGKNSIVLIAGIACPDDEHDPGIRLAVNGDGRLAARHVGIPVDVEQVG
ncbi:hypothetical protein D3C81_1963020 [compost metagenome]